MERECYRPCKADSVTQWSPESTIQLEALLFWLSAARGDGRCGRFVMARRQVAVPLCVVDANEQCRERVCRARQIGARRTIQPSPLPPAAFSARKNPTTELVTHVPPVNSGPPPRAGLSV